MFDFYKTGKAQKDASVVKNEDWQELKSMELDDWLSFVSDDDDIGITNVTVKAKAPTADEHLVAKFQEINDFFRANKRQPESNMANISELMLFKRLEAIRGNDQQCHALVDFDEFSLLPLTHEVSKVAESKAQYKPEPKVINSIDDIFNDDDFGLLGDAEDSIFNMRHVNAGPRAESDFVAKRKPIKDFKRYELQFKQTHSELRSGVRLLQNFSEKDIIAGKYFVMDGVLLYVESIDFETKVQEFESGARIRKDGRTKIIFENGTYSRMLHRSLYKQLLKGGKTVSETIGNSEIKELNETDKSTGFIYVLSSESQDSRISAIPNLFKIGYSTTPVAKRIANASKEPTYLMAPVNVIAEYECFNMNTQKFENLIHTVFKDVCLDIEIADHNGNVCKPREWFCVPIEQVNTAIDLLVSGQIVNYRFDKTKQEIVLK